MMIQAVNKLVHMRRFRSGARRSLAAALCLALVLPMTASFAANTQLSPIQAKQATADEFPHIEVEGNFVRDEFGFLTGYYELGLRVRTPATGTFTGLSVALQYDASILTPVDWSETGADVTIENKEYYEVQLPTQKLASISTAAAHGGIPAAQGGSGTGSSGIGGSGTGSSGTGSSGTTTTTAGKKALMSFAVNSYDPVAFPGDTSDPDVTPDATTLAVVRFRVSKAVMDNISITKTSMGDYEVKCGKDVVTDIDSLLNACAKVLTSGTWTGEALVGFTPDADIKKAGDESYNADAQMALDYRGGFETVNGTAYINEYYHVPEYRSDNAGTYDANVQETIEGKNYTFNIKPKTVNNLVLAVDPTVTDTATAWGTGKFSYITNLIENKHDKYVKNDENYITFPVVSKRSFMAQGDQLGNLTTIVYVDWDNTLLGTQVVPKNVDIRQLVSDHVAEHFIYHDDINTAYGSNDLNNPLEGNPADPKALVSSLKRIDNYRGKYTANGPATESTTDSTVVTDGGSYPLTNKLDYVFLKRPMTHTNAFDEVTNPKPDPDDHTKYPDGVTDTQYIADLAAYQAAYDAWYWGKTEWSQQVDDAGDLVWDAERPYAYGWAECTIDNYEDVWTTLGMGELGSTAATTETGANEATKGYSGASTGGYQAIPSTSVASVTYDGDADFAFADLSKGFNKSMVFLKAIYEPGEGLVNEGNFYRLIKKPYYNKFNGAAASDGGAYSISVTYERATVTNDGNLCGVARFRDPVVRQDTTTDLKWEESTTPLVNHNLTNANWTETYQNKSKTTYTKLDVPNSEEIVVEMSYSARQNKVDFFLRENYGTNFVAAGARTDTNSSRDFAEYAADNYNYYVNDTVKIPSTYYAPTAYGDREGTYGFVLFGTLNYLMEQATGYAHNTVTSTDFYDTVTNSLVDANLMDSSGNPITGYSNITATMEVLKNAALAAEGHKGATDEADYWNAERDCAELTYHQLQHYMNGAGLLSRTTADDASHKIKWCHLHTDCAALLSGKPLTWADLIQTAKNKNSTNIEKLTVQEIETNFHLRTDGAGSTGWTPTNFAAKVIDAVEKLMDTTGPGIAQADITWDQVQYYIDKGVADQSASDMNDYGADHYWWYDGKGLDDDLAAGETVFDRVKLAADAAHATPNITLTMPDDITPVAERKAKLNLIKDAFPADANEPGENWIKFTENLTAGQDASDAGKVVAFTNFDDFVTQFVDAVHTKTTSATWTDIQAQIIGEPTPATDYWWHNGGVNVTDLASLLKAAKKGGDAWDGVDFNKFDGLNLSMAADLKGTAIDSSNYATVKTKIAAYANINNADLTNSAWDNVQSTIINGTWTSVRTGLEKPYYWWKAGGTKPTLTFTPTGENNEGKADKMAELLGEAYFRITFNGYTASDWSTLTDADLATGRLVKSQNGGETKFEDLGQLTVAADLTTIQNAVKSAFEAKNGTSYTPYPTPPTQLYTPIDWTSLQAAILGDTTSNPEYWWKKLDSKGNTPAVDFGNLNTALSDFIAGGFADPTNLIAEFTVDKLSNMGFTLDGVTPVDQATVDAINADWATNVMMSQGMGGMMTLPLTWKEVQFLIMSPSFTGMYCTMDTANSEMMVDSMGVVPPDWVTAGGYSLRSMMAMRKLSPEQQRAQQTQDATDYQTALTEALGADPALVAAMTENVNYMDSLKALAEALGFELTAKTGNKTYDMGADTKLHETTNNEATENKTTENQTVTNEANQDETADDKTAGDKTYDKTADVVTYDINNSGEAEQKTQQEQQTAGASGTEKKETAENTATTVDNTAALNGETGEGQPQEEKEQTLTTNTDSQTPETGQGDVSILDTSQAGVDPPEVKPPEIIGLVYIEGPEKTTEGVNVA